MVVPHLSIIDKPSSEGYLMTVVGCSFTFYWHLEYDTLLSYVQSGRKEKTNLWN